VNPVSYKPFAEISPNFTNLLQFGTKVNGLDFEVKRS